MAETETAFRAAPREVIRCSSRGEPRLTLERRCYVIRPLLGWVCDRDRRANLRRVLTARTRALDWGGRDRAFRGGDSDRCKGDASEGSCRLTVLPECDSADRIGVAETVE